MKYVHVFTAPDGQDVEVVTDDPVAVVDGRLYMVCRDGVLRPALLTWSSETRRGRAFPKDPGAFVVVTAATSGYNIANTHDSP